MEARRGTSAGPDPTDEARQPTLPLDVAADEPVPYALTARGRLAIDDAALPELSVVPAPAPERGDPLDPRSAQARALRRAGRSVAEIAEQLGVDPAVAATWCSDVKRPQERRDEVAARVTRLPTTHVDDSAFARRRAAAAAELGERLTAPGAVTFAAGLGIVAGAAEVSSHALVVHLDDLPVARAVMSWLVASAGASKRAMRLSLEVGPALPGDVEAHRWAEALALRPERVTPTPWRAAPRPDAVRGSLRVADSNIAATVAGWRDALLEVTGDAPTL